MHSRHRVRVVARIGALAAWLVSAAAFADIFPSHPAGHDASGATISSRTPYSPQESEADLVRLLEQATWGPNDALLAHAKSIGAAAFVDEQLAMPGTKYPVYPPVPSNRPDDCIDDRTLPLTPTSHCARDNYTLFQLQREFFRNAVSAPDQLRQRVAFALSQILVTSGTDINLAYAMQRYQQMLADLAFGNFRDVLLQVTLSPVMGNYLDMANNVKPNAKTGVEPNENYARELLQLFAIGTIELGQDGTPLTDLQGKPIATYDQEAIEGFAHVFTGWTYPTVPGATPKNLNPRYFDGPMEARPANHDVAAKTLLDGRLLPAAQSMDADLAAAIDSVFNHPNTAPFIAKQLIQKLVTGDPSPSYVRRVAAVFDDNGAGRRGDLKAVLRALLLDPEARGAAKSDPGYGRLREPVQFVVAIARALNATTDGVFFRAQANAMGQPVYSAPSVFNFYPPDYVVPGTDIIGPEFALQNTSSALARINYVNTLAYGGDVAADATVYGSTGTHFDWSALTALAANPAALVAKLDSLLLHGTLSPAAQATIVNAVTAVNAADALGRARMALYLVASSAQYQVER